MSLSIAASSVLHPAQHAAAPLVTPANPSQDSGTSPSGTAAALLTPATPSGLPQVQMTSDMLAAIQSGANFRAPDAARTAAQNATPAYAIVKDAKTGEVLGGVWPNVATVSKVDMPVDNRLTGNTNWAEAAQILAGDIQKATGNDVAIQYFQAGDPNAPTWQSVEG